jgi:pilus assembly protein CpaB
MNKRFVIALVGAAVFGLLAILVAQNYLQQQIREKAQQDVTQVVIATADIPIGTTIAAQQVRTENYPRSLIPEGALTKTEAVVERVAITDIAAKTPILARYLAAPGSPPGPAGQLQPGMRAVSVRVDEASSVAGFALAGNYVDVIVIIQPPVPDAKPVAKTILQNIKVLANGQQTQTRADGKPMLSNTVTLEVTPAQAERIKLAESEGKLQLAIRNSTDRLIGSTPGYTKTEVLDDPGLIARSTGGAHREAPPPRATPTIPPLQVVRAASASPTPIPRQLVTVELIEGSKRSKLEYAPELSKKN